MTVIFCNILFIETTKLKDKQDLTAMAMLSSMKADLKSAGRVPASSTGRSLLESSPLKTKIQVVTDLPKATQGFSDKAETDSTRVYFHGTWVVRCWMLH